MFLYTQRESFPTFKNQVGARVQLGGSCVLSMHEALGSILGISSQKSDLEGMISREPECQLGYCISDVFLSISMACRKMNYISVFVKREKCRKPAQKWTSSIMESIGRKKMDED